MAISHSYSYALSVIGSQIQILGFKLSMLFHLQNLVLEISVVGEWHV